jgi:hypothetical protein
MKKTIIANIISLYAFVSIAQQAPIVLQSGNNSKFFNTLNEAYNAAANGDIIYLPSGSFRMDNVLNKQLNIYGVGWRPDSSSAVGGPTYIVTDFNVGKGGSNSIFSGINMPITQFKLIDSIRSIIIERSNINVVTYQNNGVFTNSLFINECLLNFVFPPRSGITEMNNCIINGGANSGNGNRGGILKFKNSVMLNVPNTRAFDYLDGIELTNSIVFCSQATNLDLFYSSTVLLLSNTLFIGELSRVNVSLSGTGNTRKEQSERDNIFTKYTGGNLALEHDLHTKPACNCSDKGVYSGSGNFRAIPPVHIASKEVKTSANNEFLNIKIRVKTDN